MNKQYASRKRRKSAKRSRRNSGNARRLPKSRRKSPKKVQRSRVNRRKSRRKSKSRVKHTKRSRSNKRVRSSRRKSSNGMFGMFGKPQLLCQQPLCATGNFDVSKNVRILCQDAYPSNFRVAEDGMVVVQSGARQIEQLRDSFIIIKSLN